MSEQQQPECPAEYRWMKQDDKVYNTLSGMGYVTIFKQPFYSEKHNTWACIVMDYGNRAWLIPCVFLSKDHPEIESLRARLAEAEDKLSKIQDLLDGVYLSSQRVNEYDGSDDDLTALVDFVAEVQEVLKGE